MLKIGIARINNFAGSLNLDQWIFVSSGFSCLLVLMRMIVTGQPSYLFLPWNLFLAFLPWWIASVINREQVILRTKILLAISLGLWLLFIPNSFYIITDLFHLSKFRLAPAWYDLLMIFSFAWNGILFGIVSLWRIEKIIKIALGKNFSFLLVFAVMWLCAFGIYIGRFLRYNSWDVITDPFSLAGEILGMALHPFEYGYAWGMTICYAVFMTLAYLTTRKMSEIRSYG